MYQGINEFERLLEDLIVEQMPTSYVEGFKDTRKKVISAFPKKTKIVVATIVGVMTAIKYGSLIKLKKALNSSYVNMVGGMDIMHSFPVKFTTAKSVISTLHGGGRKEMTQNYRLWVLHS